MRQNKAKNLLERVQRTIYDQTVRHHFGLKIKFKNPTPPTHFIPIELISHCIDHLQVIKDMRLNPD